MKELIIQIKDAIDKRLYLGAPRKHDWGTYSIHWNLPIAIDEDRKLITMIDADCGTVDRSWDITYEQWTEGFNTYGLWKKVGMWEFVKADDPAASNIRYCNHNPEGAGRHLYNCEIRIKELESQVETLTQQVFKLENKNETQINIKLLRMNGN